VEVSRVGCDDVAMQKMEVSGGWNRGEESNSAFDGVNKVLVVEQQ
jgi:hypothetical protein